MWTRRLHAISADEHEALCGLLIDAVESGASVGFLAPMTRAKAETFWRNVAASLAQRILIVGEDERGIVGTVQVIFASAENQPHRGELIKLIVHRRARQQGVGAALMEAAESAARDAGRTVLMLDTATDEAERLYLRRGWERCGQVRDFFIAPDGTLGTTHLYTKRLR